MPNVMVVPLRVPVRSSVWLGFEIMMLPVRVDPDCCQFRVKVPEYAPLYCPDHFPDRSGPAAAGADEDSGGADEVGGDEDAAAVALDSAELIAFAAEDTLVEFTVPLLLQPTTSVAAKANTATNAAGATRRPGGIVR